MSYKNRTLQVSYNGSTWDFTEDSHDLGSNPKLHVNKPTYLYFVAVSDDLTFNANTPITWDNNSQPPGSTTTLINQGCLRIIDTDSDNSKTRYSFVLNMYYSGTAVTTGDPIIVDKPSSRQ